MIGASLVPNVVGHGLLVPNRALWVSLDIEVSKLGILNVYAPMDLQARASFWLDVVETLLKMEVTLTYPSLFVKCECMYD